MFFDFLSLDEKAEIMTRCKSYLKHIAQRNPEFLKFVSTEELTSVFLNEVELPEWVIQRKSDMELVVHLNEFIQHNKDQSFLFELEQNTEPQFKPQPAILIEGITDPQKNFLSALCKDLKIPLPFQLDQMTKKEATILISKLKAQKESRFKK